MTPNPKDRRKVHDIKCFGEWIKVSELVLGDVVRLTGTDCWNDCIVSQITEDEITLFRPYGHNADFSYTGGVCCYVGIEEFKRPIDDAPIFRIRHGGKLK